MIFHIGFQSPFFYTNCPINIFILDRYIDRATEIKV